MKLIPTVYVHSTGAPEQRALFENLQRAASKPPDALYFWTSEPLPLALDSPPK